MRADDVAAHDWGAMAAHLATHVEGRRLDVVLAVVIRP
jgi:hypothetical protein